MDSEMRPNILMIHPHNLGQYLGCYGWDIETPHIDGIARDGVRFENYFCTASHCSPARGSLWTGNYPHNNGLIGLAHLGWELNEDEETMIDHLNEAGYESYLFGLQHITAEPASLGFDHIDGSVHEFNVDEPARDVADRVEDFLMDGAEYSDEPFFASVGFSEVHRQPLVERCLDCGWTFDLPGYESDDPEEVEPLPYLPDRPGIREDLAHFHGMVHAIDEAVGQIITALEASNYDETLVIFTTDHGIGFPRAMGTCYDPGVETALIMRWDGQLEEGAVRDELLSNVDFSPTILDLIGEEPPGGIDGRSFASLLTGGEYKPRKRIFHEFTWHSKYIPMRAVRTKNYKYIRNFGDLPKVYIPAPLFTSESGLDVREEFYAEGRPTEELYDLRKDPLEKNNLADDPEYADELEECRLMVEDWMHDSDDRLLEGDWPPTRKQEERVKKSPWVPREIDEFC